MDTERKEYLQRFQAELDACKKKGAPGCTTNEFLLAMLANMSKVKDMGDEGIILILSPFGLSHRLEYHNERIPVEKRAYESYVVQAIIEALENLIFMYKIHLKDLRQL